MVTLQYRKRYELLQLMYFMPEIPQNSYNTASGMNCCNISYDIPFNFIL